MTQNPKRPDPNDPDGCFRVVLTIVLLLALLCVSCGGDGEESDYFTLHPDGTLEPGRYDQSVALIAALLFFCWQGKNVLVKRLCASLQRRSRWIVLLLVVVGLLFCCVACGDGDGEDDGWFWFVQDTERERFPRTVRISPHWLLF